MKTNQIQISYDDSVDPLPAETENRIVENLTLLLKELDHPEQPLSLFFCSLDTMIQLNSTYRNKQKPTDLLSWLYEEEEPGQTVADEPWGELVYCLEVIQKQAAASGWTLSDELLRLTVHGLVHLMGYDHESDDEEAEMLGIETGLLERIGLADVYST